MLVQADGFGDLEVTFAEDITTVPFSASSLLDQTQGVEGVVYEPTGTTQGLWGGMEEDWATEGDEMVWQTPLGYTIDPPTFVVPAPSAI